MSKTVLMIVALLLVLMGILGLIPALTFMTLPAWLAIVEIVVGLVCVYVSSTDK